MSIGNDRKRVEEIRADFFTPGGCHRSDEMQDACKWLMERFSKALGVVEAAKFYCDMTHPAVEEIMGIKPMKIRIAEYEKEA